MFYSRSVSHLAPGVNIFGYVFAEHGVGEEVRHLIRIAQQAELEFAVLPYTETFSRQAVSFSDLGTGESAHDINLICINADTIPKFVDLVGPEMLEGRYNIAMWAWEVEEMPAEMARSARHFDEIWSCSRFSAEAIAGSVSCEVHALPLPISIPAARPARRQDLGLAEDFLFLFCFDFNSIFERKNALAVIAAFERAFAPGEGAQLLIKTINGGDFQPQMEKLHAAALRHRDVRVVDGYLSSDEQRQLMNTCDAYVSLHRSEGYGFTMAEAMALGKPVIATGYSGNMDFMSAENSYLVPFEKIPVPAGCDPYPRTTYWADPCVDSAAELMRRVRERPDEARRKSARARADIEQIHTPRAKAEFVQRRLRAIREQPRHSGRNGARYSVLGYGSAPPADATVLHELVKSREMHEDRTYRAFDSLERLLASRLAAFSHEDVLEDVVCGSLDGVRPDPEGGFGVWGWAYDPRTKSPARAIALLVNERQIPAQILLDNDRPDVAAHLGEPALANVGWSFLLPERMLANGENLLEAYALLEDGRFGRLAGNGGGGLSVNV